MSKEKINLNISGMTCVNCSNGIENFLKRKEGVLDTKVSFASNEGEFTIDTDLFSKDNLIANIEKLGYKVEEDFSKLEKEQIKSFEKLKKLFFTSMIFTLGIFALVFLNLFDDKTTKMIIFLLASIVQFYGGARFYLLAYKSLSNRNYDMNVLVALGTSAAYFYSTFVLFLPNLFPEHLRFIYFDGAAVIITFVLLGRYLEARSKQKASDFLKKLMNLAPQKANKILEDGQIKTVLANSLEVGNCILIKSGEKIPADGKIIEGKADIDTSMITGEAMPVFKQIEDEVLSGTLNTNGVIKVKVLKQSKDTTLSKIITLLKSAQSKQIPISRFADKIANIFVPTVILISIITFIVWTLLGELQNAILTSISVLIISCPCALGLATPIAIVSSVSRGAKEGLLIKNPEILEIIKDIKYAVFDKTGTLTKGEISVENTDIDPKYFSSILSIESLSEHPISKAIVNYIKQKKQFSTVDVDNIDIIAGKGIKAKINDNEFLLGNEKLLLENSVKIEDKHKEFFLKELDKANGAILVSINNKTVGSFSLIDKLKDDAISLIENIKNEGIEPILLTGDNKVTASKIAEQLKINKVYSEVIPTQKYEIISNLQKDGKVMFVGDGINDAPSIKKADIGITLNSGSDITKDAGDIILINNELLSISKSINLSKQSIKIIKQNLFWAFAYNAVGIPLAAGLFYSLLGHMLTPMYAGIAMSFSSVSVVLNSLRLKIKKI
ncbi:copper-translocating P-type ATPase [Malaciobacter molluscorum LMG 25693]|uniref:Copper-transporting ATPase n=1 Tax=Malaciobacter molluscorum LMG 25693 TaxID=870501 RepID=A0A2G1DFT1_9BACT|nr:heavy metal translocating P-type ATPase [Malaciobacter molluscorum]AXX93647.1 heavy metal translocating P-type ATPase [Malaciobacter molluscorum LMG 25693]PHO17351.1 copper-translocating P-type ATPase [Malaciobacter molluscorum LMG 25693]